MWLVTSNIDSHSIEWALYNLVPRAFPSYLQGKSPGNEVEVYNVHKYKGTKTARYWLEIIFTLKSFF